MYRKQSAMTMIELTLVMSLLAVILGALVSLYGYAVGRATNSVASYSTTSNASQILDEIDKSVKEAMAANTVSTLGKPALKLTMPSTPRDTDGDGVADDYDPSKVSRFGQNKYALGKRVWYYLSDSSGALGKTGNFLWRATRNDDAAITSGNLDRSFVYYYDSTQQRFPNVQGFTFAVDTTNKKVTTTVTTSTYSRNDTLMSNTTSTEGDSMTVSRGTYWENWRK